MRPYDGQNAAEITDAPAAVVGMIAGADFDGDGQIFWLRHLLVRNSHAAQDLVLALYDQNVGVGALANQRFRVDVPAATTLSIDFPAPGISFLVNITGGKTAAVGMIDTAEAHVSGYLTGGM